MIVSDEFRYVFIGTPHTACTAIFSELCELYGGEHKLRKHASAAQFLRNANSEERRYYFFVGIRNPLDATVTRYLKLKNNQGGMFTDPTRFAENGGFITRERLDMFQYIQDRDLSFSDYFSQFVKKPPYGDTVLHNIETSDFVIRYENLQEGFSQVLKNLGIVQTRPLPVVNRTAGKTNSNWESYYNERNISQAKELFSQNMEKLGYSFPVGW